MVPCSSPTRRTEISPPGPWVGVHRRPWAGVAVCSQRRLTTDQYAPVVLAGGHIADRPWLASRAASACRRADVAGRPRRRRQPRATARGPPDRAARCRRLVRAGGRAVPRLSPHRGADHRIEGRRSVARDDDVPLVAAVVRVDLRPTQVAGDRQQQVEKLLRDLDADQRAVRQRAEARRVARVGSPDSAAAPSAGIVLRTAAVKGAVSKIRVALELRSVGVSSPSRVTFEGKLPLSQLLKAISHQTGNVLDDMPSIGPTRTELLAVNFAATPFWRIGRIDRCRFAICLRCRFTLFETGPAPEPGKSQSELAVIDSGPFRLAVKSAKLREVFGSKDLRQLRCELSLTP